MQREQQKPINNFRRATARRLRSNATNAEALLWRHLHRLETQGTHFRRQVPIGSLRRRLRVSGGASGDRVGWFATWTSSRPTTRHRAHALAGSGRLSRSSLLEQRGIAIAECGAGSNLRRIAAAYVLKSRFTPPRLTPFADPPPQGEGEGVRAKPASRPASCRRCRPGRNRR